MQKTAGARIYCPPMTLQNQPMALVRTLLSPGALGRWVIGLGLFAASAIVVGTMWALGAMRHDYLTGAESRLGDISLLLGEQTRRTFQEVDQILRHAKSDVQAQLTRGLPLTREGFHQVFKEHIAHAPHLSALKYVTANGDLVIDTSQYPAPPWNHRDWEPLNVHRGGTVQGLLISVPVRTPGASEITIPFSRAVRNAAGQLLGVISTAVRTEHLGGIYSALNLGPGGGVRLYLSDGSLLVGSAGLAGEPGENFSQTEVFQRAIASKESIVVRHGDLAGGTERLSAMRALVDPPAVIRVSMTEYAVLEEWRHHALIVGPLAALTALLLGFVSVFLARQLKEDAALRQQTTEGRTRLRAIVDSAMDAIITIDDKQRIVLFNDAAERIFGHSRENTLGTPLNQLIPERFRAAHAKHVERFGSTGETTRRMGAKLVLYGLRADGEEFPIDASISQVSVGGLKLFTVILRDVTDRVRADAAIARSHADLRSLSRAAHEALEGERRRVAREMHDELGQQLTAMKIDVSELEKSLLTERPDLQNRCIHLRGLIDQTVASSRRIAADLRPLMLDDLGLGAALEWLTQNTTKSAGLDVRLTVDETLAEVSEPHASAIYRIVQESLTNVVRHADAKVVEVHVHAENSHASVTVRDNGKGIEPTDQVKHGSFGLLGIKERARLLGGEATIDNHPGGGVIVKARLPFAPVSTEDGE
jgi:PAS domain S-box-containing protein